MRWLASGLFLAVPPLFVALGPTTCRDSTPITWNPRAKPSAQSSSAEIPKQHQEQNHLQQHDADDHRQHPES